MSKTTKAVYVTAALALASLATAAEARRYEPSEESRYEDDDSAPRRTARRHASRPMRHAERDSSEVGGRPRQWCGWWMRTQRGGGPEYNLAWNWSHWGRPSGPQVGAVVVWRHHVGEIKGRASNGQWIVKSGNDGGRVRERARSVAGAVFRVG